MILAICGLALGLALGFLVPWSIPVAYSKLFSIALLASLDSVFGGLRAAGEGNFDVGDHLGIDLYYVALLALGFRIFSNLGRIRQYLLKKH